MYCFTVMNIKTRAYFDIESALQASPCTHFTRPGTVVICIYHKRVPVPTVLDLEKQDRGR
jgi:hypothetical protein